MVISLQLKQQEQQQKQKRRIIFRSRPELEKGVNLVKHSSDKPVFQALVADELEGKNSKALWIDSGNNCSTYALQAAGSQATMRKVEIARCFTPFQHVELLHQIEEFIEPETTLIVAPEVTLLYEDGQINEYEAEELFRDAWTELTEVVEENGLKLLVSANGELSYVVEAASNNTIEVAENSNGLRYKSDSFETEAYRNGSLVQTTLPLWCSEKVVF